MFKWFLRKKPTSPDAPQKWQVRAYGIMFHGDSEADVSQIVENYRVAFGLRPLVLRPTRVS